MGFRDNMKFRADICELENGRDKILSVCQCGPHGEIEHEVIIQRGPKEYDEFDDHPGPKISYEDLHLDIVPGPERIEFSGDSMMIVLSGSENIEADISRLTQEEQEKLRTVAKALFK